METYVIYDVHVLCFFLFSGTLPSIKEVNGKTANTVVLDLVKHMMNSADMCKTEFYHILQEHVGYKQIVTTQQ